VKGFLFEQMKLVVARVTLDEVVPKQRWPVFAEPATYNE
jgi:hypothetical protein